MGAFTTLLGRLFHIGAIRCVKKLDLMFLLLRLMTSFLLWPLVLVSLLYASMLGSDLSYIPVVSL